MDQFSWLTDSRGSFTFGGSSGINVVKSQHPCTSMSTRSGRSYKGMEEQQQDGGQPCQTISPQTKSDVIILAQMVQMMLEDRRRGHRGEAEACTNRLVCYSAWCWTDPVHRTPLLLRRHYGSQSLWARTTLRLFAHVGADDAGPPY